MHLKLAVGSGIKCWIPDQSLFRSHCYGCAMLRLQLR